MKQLYHKAIIDVELGIDHISTDYDKGVAWFGVVGNVRSRGFEIHVEDTVVYQPKQKLI